MKKDIIGALVLAGVFVVMLATGVKFPWILEYKLHLTRPVSTILILGAVAVLYEYNYRATALVAGLLSIYLLKTIWVNWPSSDERRLYLEVGRDNARFDPNTSIDLQFANGTAKHDMPHLLAPPSFTELLIFPPSAETQRDMNGE
jgi:hypothetical protein